MDDLISRQVAIDDIETVNPSMPLSVNWVKNWVKTLPPAQPEVTKEAVELYCRQRCLTVITNELFNEMKERWSAQPDIDEWCTDCKEYDSEKHCCPRFNRVIRNALKDAQPERKTGKWIDYSDDGYVECPFCGSATNCDDNINELHYCFSCGAKMEVEG